MLRNLKEEATTLTKWLVSIPSISGTRGESIAIRAIYDGLTEFPYFRAYPDNLHYVSHEDQKNSSIIGLVKAYDKTQDTIIILCHVDTQGTENFGNLKSFACKESELREKLSNLSLKRDIVESLDDEHNLFGLGIFECKAVTGSVIAMIREFSDNTMVLDFNLIFLCLSRTNIDHEGIKAVQSYLDPIITAENLNPLLAISFIPAQKETSDEDLLHLYSAQLGLVEPSFFILGKGTNFGTPFNGFSPTLIASSIIRKLELNPEVLRDLSDHVLTPSFAHIFSRNQNAQVTPDAVQISFNLPFLNLDLRDLTERLKEIAAEAIEDCSELCDERESLHHYLKGHNFLPQIKDAEVISYQDLFDRAEANYRGNLNAAITALLEKCRVEGLSFREMCFCIIERLNELSHLPRPSVVVFLGHTFIPCAKLRTQDKKDREIIMCLEKAAVKLGQITGKRPSIVKACAPLDANFLRPVGVDNALRTLSVECPVSDHNFYSFNCPAVTLGIPGDDLGYPTERVNDLVFDYICTFVPAMMDSLSILRGRKSEDKETLASQDKESENKTQESLAQDKVSPPQESKSKDTPSLEQKEKGKALEDNTASSNEKSAENSPQDPQPEEEKSESLEDKASEVLENTTTKALYVEEKPQMIEEKKERI